MGLKDRNKSYVEYLSIWDGKIVKESKDRSRLPKDEELPGDKEVKQRENKNGDIVYYIEYDQLTGSLDNVILDTEGKFGDRIELHISDVDDKYILKLPFNSSYGRSLLERLGRIDINSEVSLQPYSFTPDGEDRVRSGLVIKQGGEKLATLYTRDNPNGRPDLVQKKRGNKVTWDDTDRVNFYYDKLEEFISKFKDKVETVEDPVTIGDVVDEHGDVPF